MIVQVAIGILKKNNKFLVAQRPEGKPYCGYWEFPGGKIEKSEQGKQALIRELQEELGIEVKSCQFLFCENHQYPDKAVLLEVWHVLKFLGEPYNKERQTLRWVTIAEMEQLQILAGNRLILEKIKLLMNPFV